MDKEDVGVVKDVVVEGEVILDLWLDATEEQTPQPNPKAIAAEPTITDLLQQLTQEITTGSGKPNSQPELQ